MIGWACRQLVGWLAVMAVIAVVASNRGLINLSPGPSPVAATAPAATPHPAPRVDALVFHAEKNGHVMLTAAVNGAPLRLIVDTGATLVTLTREDAAAAGITGSLNYSLSFNTANGRTRAAPVVLREVRIGQLEIRDVQAAVVENLSVSLLGQSFLNRLDSYQMRDGELTLRW